MSDDWHRFFTDKQSSFSDDAVEVHLSGGRKQKVHVTEEDDIYRLTSTVLGAGSMASLGRKVDIRQQIWFRNRSRSLVGFRLDERRRLVGEAWVPKAGLTAAEFKKYLLSVARSCDTFEAVLSSIDME